MGSYGRSHGPPVGVADFHVRLVPKIFYLKVTFWHYCIKREKAEKTIVMKTTGMMRSVMIGSILFSQFSCKENNEAISSNSVADKVVTVEAVEPDADLHLALEAFANKDYARSEESIMKAAKSMEPIAVIATGEQRAAIENSIAELKDLAHNVAIDHVNGIRDLNYFFSRAGQALAGYKVFVAETYINHHNPQQVGEALSNALDRIEANMKYYDREITADERKSLEAAKILSERLKHGELVTDEEIRKDLDDLKFQVKKWDEEFNQRKLVK